MAIDLPFLKLGRKGQDQIIAVDVGRFATKAVRVLAQDGALTLAGYAVAKTPEGLEGFDPPAFAEFLKTVLAPLGSPGAPVAVLLGVEHTVVKLVEMPMLPVGELRKVIKTNPKGYLHQELPDHVFDCYCVPMQPGSVPTTGSPASWKQKVIVAGAPASLVANISNGIRQAGFEPAAVVPGLIAPINTLERAAGELLSKEIIAYVDLGHLSSTICILQQGEPVLNRVVPIGGKKITEELTNVLKIDYAEAEEIKTTSPEAALITLEQVVRPLGRELRALVDFFEHQQDRQVTKVFACGGSACSPPILQILEGELFVECKSWNPATGMTMALNPDQMAGYESVMAQLTGAVGCALAIL